MARETPNIFAMSVTVMLFSRSWRALAASTCVGVGPGDTASEVPRVNTCMSRLLRVVTDGRMAEVWLLAESQNRRVPGDPESRSSELDAARQWRAHRSEVVVSQLRG